MWHRRCSDATVLAGYLHVVWEACMFVSTNNSYVHTLCVRVCISLCMCVKITRWIVWKEPQIITELWHFELFCPQTFKSVSIFTNGNNIFLVQVDKNVNISSMTEKSITNLPLILKTYHITADAWTLVFFKIRFHVICLVEQYHSHSQLKVQLGSNKSKMCVIKYRNVKGLFQFKFFLVLMVFVCELKARDTVHRF